MGAVASQTNPFRMEIPSSISNPPDAVEIEQKPLEIDTLYRAQFVADQVVKSPLFPCYTPEYINSQEGIKKTALYCYSKVYDGVCAIGHALQKIVDLVKRAVHKLLTMNGHALGKALESLKKKIQPTLDAVFPINPVNGHRHFVGIPRSWEKTLGDNVFYPLNTRGLQRTEERLEGDEESMAAKVNAVVHRLKSANTELLNPSPEKTKFDYRADTVISTQINAFAVPGGGMVVFSQLIKEIDSAIKNGKYKQSTIEFADGSRAVVDLTGVDLNSCVAALLGHEMTHVASRHSIVSLILRAVRSILIDIARFFSVSYLKSRDKEYQNALAKRDVQVLQAKELSYARINHVFSWIGDAIKHLSALLLSRTNEYEADATGTWMAHRAGYNPLGAIYLQEVLKNSETGFLSTLHKKLGFLFSHPDSDLRKAANFAVIREIDPERLKGRVQLTLASDKKYDIERSNAAVKYARSMNLET